MVNCVFKSPSLLPYQKFRFAATECIERRGRRPDSELIRDNPDEELVEEIALISEIRNVLRNLQKEVEAQQDQNRAARQRLEADWSDKKHAYGIDSINSSLNNKSATILFRPGATRYLDELSGLDTHWTALNNVSDSIAVNRPKSAGSISPWPHWMTVKR